MYSIRAQPVSWCTRFSSRPRRTARAWVSVPTYSPGTSIVTRSTGSCSLPSISLVTTVGRPTVSSNSSRRSCSTRMASASSPRPCISQVSGRSVGSMRTDTLPTSSWSRRFLMRRAVSFLPDLPEIGEVLIPMVIEIDGSSTVSGGRGRGSFGSARVSPIMTSSIPAMATSSPGPALSAGVRVRPSVTSSSVILTFLIVPSVRHQATVWPLFIVPEWMRSSAQRLLGVVDRRRDRVEQRLHQRPQVGAVGRGAVRGARERGLAGLAVAVDDREVEVVDVHARVLEQFHEQLVGLVDDLADAGVGAVGLVDDE